VDSLLTLGYSKDHPSLRISRQLRGIRKRTAKLTGLHGVFSQKRLHGPVDEVLTKEVIEDETQATMPDSVVSTESEIIEDDTTVDEEETQEDRDNTVSLVPQSDDETYLEDVAGLDQIPAPASLYESSGVVSSLNVV